MSHGGNPEAGTNPFVGIDGTGLTITSPNGPDTWVIPVSDSFTVAMTWDLTGIFANWLASLGLAYTVTYTFAGLGNAGCLACVACVGCVNCVGCVACVGCVGLRGAVGVVGRSS